MRVVGGFCRGSWGRYSGFNGNEYDDYEIQVLLNRADEKLRRRNSTTFSQDIRVAGKVHGSHQQWFA
jgi:hypothetical protein